jgi:hypothetical protein
LILNNVRRVNVRQEFQDKSGLILSDLEHAKPEFSVLECGGSTPLLLRFEPDNSD